jgi:calcium-dependent protein kinase
MTLVRNRYRVVRQLSETLYGGIYLCNDELQRPRRVVLKRVSLLRAMNLLDLRKPERQAPDDPRQEKAFAALQRQEAAPHPHVVRYLDDFTEGHALYFVLEYCAGGDLYSSVNQGRNRRLAQGDALCLVQQVASAVCYLHARGLAHRDLSLENVMLSRGRCKLGDFGLACRADQLCVETVGKAYYMAPEVVAPQAVYDPKAADAWSLGIIFFILVTGSPLVPLATEEAPAFRTFRQVGVREVLLAWKMADALDESAMDLLNGLLQCDPSKRLSMQQVMQHQALQSRRAAAA